MELKLDRNENIVFNGNVLKIETNSKVMRSDFLIMLSLG